jgi:cation diffusion facilitator CzcD-associated flavoprotein CzcO
VIGMRIAIVGAGFAGMGAAIKLREAGFTDVTIFDRGDDVGGTWRDNTYPGCACDIRSHLYSFSFFRNPDWTSEYPRQPEIQAYLQRCADHFGLRPLLRLGTEVTEVRWDEPARTWWVHTSGAEVLEFDVVLNGTGPLSRPKVPEMAGLDRFEGSWFHSARWDHDHDLTGERVAVVGTGASAVQFVPEIAGVAERVYVHQRTPPWVMPRDDHPFSPAQRARFRRFPVLSWLHRARIYVENELLVLAFLGNKTASRKATELATAFLDSQVADPELRAKVLPDYAPGCKRVLITSDWYPTLQRDDVELVTGGVAEIREHSVVSEDGTERGVDTIILATGFAATEFLSPMKVFGRDGVELSEAWRSGAATHLGLAVAGFPNFWLLAGPSTGLGHNSLVFMIEAQLHTLIGALQAQVAEGVRAWELRAATQQRSYALVQRRMGRTVWASGCHSWYLTDDGRNDLLWPATTVEYWCRTRHFDQRAFRALR